MIVTPLDTQLEATNIGICSTCLEDGAAQSQGEQGERAQGQPRRELPVCGLEGPLILRHPLTHLSGSLVSITQITKSPFQTTIVQRYPTPTDDPLYFLTIPSRIHPLSTPDLPFYPSKIELMQMMTVLHPLSDHPYLLQTNTMLQISNSIVIHQGNLVE